ncbi:MAG: hypothetical protein FWG63_11450 [Defluviitaleaceae bacterium]|nr:hypothetical protein [Defluviitaleaceae bacterium]
MPQPTKNRSTSFDVKPLGKRVTILFNRVNENISLFDNIEAKEENKFRDYFYWHFTESGEILKRLLCYEDMLMEEMPPVVRANSTIYYFAFQDDGFFSTNLICLLEDILWTTSDRSHPLYYYGWTDLLQVLEHMLNLKKGDYHEGNYFILEETISQLEERAKEQGLLR